MRIAYISMNIAGLKCLEAILKEKGTVVAIFTLKEKYSKKISDSASFDKIAKKYSIPLYKINNINEPENISLIKKLKPDIILAIGWSQLLSENLLKIPEKGCVGMHPALLPKNRGRAAIPWQIINGEKTSGVSLFYLDKGVDSGDIIAQKEFELKPDETAQTFYNKMIAADIELIRENLKSLKKGTAPRKKQDENKATYLEKRTGEGMIEWGKKTREIYDLIRAITHPYVGAYTYYKGKKMIIWKASPSKYNNYIGSAGRIVHTINNKGMVVRTGDSTLLIERVQLENEKETNSDKILKKGERLGIDIYQQISKIKR